MDNIIKWGIWGTGQIAQVFARALTGLDGHKLTAIASRSMENAQKFQKEFSIHNAYEGLEAMLESDIDIVYIASPHLFHAQDMKTIIQGKKHILCEKSFTINATEAKYAIEAAKAHNLFIMEALWTRFLPAYQTAKAWVDQGLIGNIQMMHLNLTSYKEFDPHSRFFDKKQGGGALLDLGVYCLSILQYFLGSPNHIQSHHLLNDAGTDQCASAILHYDKPYMSSFNISFDAATNRDAFIIGSEGHIRIEDPFHSAQHIHLYKEQKLQQSLHLPFDASPSGLGYVYEILAVGEALKQNLLEHPIMPHHDTIAVMQQMDQIRSDWGLVYDNDK